MRLAFITSLLPTALPDTGSAIANACIVGALEQAGCEVRQFGFLKRGETAEPPANSVVLARTGVDREGASLLTRTGWIRDSLRLRLPVKAARLAVADAGALREAIGREGPFRRLRDQWRAGGGRLPVVAARMARAAGRA